jgi:hypothetical protein
VTAMTTQNGGSQVLYAGMAGALDGGGTFGGHLFSTTTANTANSGTVWTDLALSQVTNDSSGSGIFNPGAFDLSSVVADPHDVTGNTIYVTVMGFTGNGVNAPHLYRSVDGGRIGQTLAAICPTLPPTASSSIRTMPIRCTSRWTLEFT